MTSQVEQRIVNMHRRNQVRGDTFFVKYAKFDSGAQD